MSNLISVKRHDRNGKLVTRNIKPGTGSSTGMGNVPAPKVSTPVTVASLTEGVRLVPSQSSSKPRTESGAPVPYRGTTVFEASDVEMYGVLSVTSTATGLELLTGGVKGAEEATAFLSAAGREHELADSAGLAHQMLLRRVAVEFYLMGLERLSEEQLEGADPELLADYLEFFAIRSIMRKDSPKIADEVLRGEIRLSDVRAVGIDHLKTGDRLEIARPAFKALRDGTAKFTVQDLTGALQERISNDVAAEVGYMLRYGSEAKSRLSRLGVSFLGGKTLGDLVAAMKRGGTSSQEDALAAVNYTERLVEASRVTVNGATIMDVLEKGRFLHEAGVDVQYAAERIRDEELHMIAATFHGTHRAVSDGWL